MIPIDTFVSKITFGKVKDHNSVNVVVIIFTAVLFLCSYVILKHNNAPADFVDNPEYIDHVNTFHKPK